MRSIIHVVLMLALAVIFTKSTSSIAQSLPDHIEYVAGGTMSPHIRLQIDLGTGDYTLTEPIDGLFGVPQVARSHLSDDHLKNLRGLAAKIVRGPGFTTSTCLRVEQREVRRRRQLARNGVLIIDHINMDAEQHFWVRFGGLAKTAPKDSNCWSHEGKALKRDMFAAAHADLRLQ